MPFRRRQWHGNIGAQLGFEDIERLLPILILAGTKAQGNQLFRLIDNAF